MIAIASYHSERNTVTISDIYVLKFKSQFWKAVAIQLATSHRTSVPYFKSISSDYAEC